MSRTTVTTDNTPSTGGTTTPKRRLLRRIVIGAIITLTPLCVIAFGVSWFVAGALLAPHQKLVGDAPAELANAQSFTIPSESGSTIAGWHVRVENSQGVIVLLHGIRTTRLSMVNRAVMLAELGFSSILIDLQAHGESPGAHITAGHLERFDAQAAVAFARRQHPGEPVGMIGVSLGGAAAVLASPLDVDAMVLEAVYPDIERAIHHRVEMRLGALAEAPTQLLLLQLRLRLGLSPDDLRPLDRMPDLGCPVLIIAGTADRHTTEADTREMFDAAREPKELWLIDSAGHVDLFAVDPAGYRERVGALLEAHFRPVAR